MQRNKSSALVSLLAERHQRVIAGMSPFWVKCGFSVFRVQAIGLLLLTVLASGCVAVPQAEYSASPSAGIEGTITDCEDGFLFLRLANGQTVELLMPDPDWLVVPQSVLKSKGRKCRVQVKRYSDVDAVGQPQLYTEITSFEWL